MKPKVKCSMVISVNGYICRPDGNEGWIAEINWDDFVADCEKHNNFMVGRTTYEVVTELDDIKVDHKVVVSRQPNIKLRPGYKIVSSPQKAVEYLSGQGISEILLAGGGKLNASFAEAGLIDELEFIVEPFAIGQGKNVLETGDYELPLKLIEVEKLSKDRVRLLYKVN
jgi:dihydrofolate reductase